MSYQFSNSATSSSVYYTFPSYDHHPNELTPYHQHHPYQQSQHANINPAYFNNYSTNFLNRNGQQSTNAANFPMRIDMNMTAYVRPPPHPDDLLFETSAQLPIQNCIVNGGSASPANSQNICAGKLVNHHHHHHHLLQQQDDAEYDDDGKGTLPQGVLASQTNHHHYLTSDPWVYLQQVKSSSVPTAVETLSLGPSINRGLIINCGEKKNLPISVKSEFNTYDNVRESNFCKKLSQKNVAKFQCVLCGKKYCRQSTLKAHIRQHSGEKPYVCNMCGKNFSQSANLNAHKRVHTGEKPFSCPICFRPFSQSSSLMTHKRTHSGERPYKCSSCDKAFTDSSTLTKHVRTHTGCKPYACGICHFSFSQSGNLSRHMKTHMKRQDVQQIIGFAQQN